MVKLVRDLTSCYEDVLTIHAEGSLEAQKLSILTLADFDRIQGSGQKGGQNRGFKKPSCVCAAPGISARLVVGVGIKEASFPRADHSMKGCCY